MIVISAPEVNPMQLGKLKLRQYEFPIAEKAFLEEVKYNPNNSKAWYSVGYCRKRLFKIQEAL